MSFYITAVATSIAALILGLGWLFAGTLLLKRWGLETNAAGLLVGRRLGVVYLAMALLLFLGRSAPPSELRSVVAIAMLVSLGLLALLGLIEFKAGRDRHSRCAAGPIRERGAPSAERRASGHSHYDPATHRRPDE